MQVATLLIDEHKEFKVYGDGRGDRWRHQADTSMEARGRWPRPPSTRRSRGRFQGEYTFVRYREQHPHCQRPPVCALCADEQTVWFDNPHTDHNLLGRKIMLHSTNDLLGSDVQGSDGSIGEVSDLYFDDHTWTVRSLVVKSGDWLARRRNVLISPISIKPDSVRGKTFWISLSRAQVRGSPDVDTQRPVSRQHEVEQYGYYGYPYYWGGSGLWGEGMQPASMMAAYSGIVSDDVARRQEAFVKSQAAFHRQRGDDPHLRSCRAVLGYHLHATDGELGHVAGFLVDDETWSLRYLIVNTSDWWFGHDVLVAPSWIDDVSWLEATLSVGLSRRAVKDAPPYVAASLPTRQQEHKLHEHHARPGYWSDADVLETDISRI